MSRVDEALRRADRHDAERRIRAAKGDVTSVPDALLLDQYPQEGKEPRLPGAPTFVGRQTAATRRDARTPDRNTVERAPTRHVAKDVDFAAAVAAHSTLQPRVPVKPGDLSRESRLVVSRDASPRSIEQYRRLANTLDDIRARSVWAGVDGVERGLKSLLVTSAEDGEGKTLTAVNIALTLSQSCGRRVLLIDADRHHPSIHHLLRLPTTVGLTDVLRSDERAARVYEVLPRFAVVSAGRPSSTQLMPDRLGATIAEYSSHFDWILLDGPAVGLGSDAGVLARVARAVILVIRSGTTTFRSVDRAIAELGRDCIIGTVLNRIDDQTFPTGC
jgi:capsular exopolysaccharide synthesis family protein